MIFSPESFLDPALHPSLWLCRTFRYLKGADSRRERERVGESEADMSLALEHQGQSVRAVSLCHSLSHFSVICAEHMSTSAITHWLLMEHKTEVDLPFTAGSTTASLTQTLFLADTHRETERDTKTHQKQVLQNHTFPMNYKCSPDLFCFFQINDKAPLFYQWRKKKKKRLFPQRWTTDCFAGGKIAVIEMVMSSLYLITFGLRCILRVAIWVIGLPRFLPLCLCGCS